MAQTSYTSTNAVTLANRAKAYERAAVLLTHLHTLNINLISLVVNPNKTVTVTLNNPLPASQLAHLSLEPDAE